MYYILRKDASAILGETMWITRDDLVLGSCSVAAFPSSEDGKKIYNLFPKKIRGTLQVVTHATVAERWNISISSSGKFSPIPSVISKEELEAIPKESLKEFASKQALYPQAQINRKKEQTEPKIVVSEPKSEAKTQVPELQYGITDEESWTTKSESQSLDSNTLCGHGVVFSEGPVASAVYAASEQLQKALAVLATAEEQAPLYIARAEKELQDELHFAELYDLSARDGYEVYRRIKELRRKRREAKDAIEAINIAKPILASISEKDLQALKEWIRKKDERVYKLRVPETFVHKERN